MLFCVYGNVLQRQGECIRCSKMMGGEMSRTCPFPLCTPTNDDCTAIQNYCSWNIVLYRNIILYFVNLCNYYL